MLWSKVATVAAHLFMGVILYLRAAKTDLGSSKSIYSCYMFVWCVQPRHPHSSAQCGPQMQRQHAMAQPKPL